MAHLKRETRACHSRTEAHPLAAAMVAGDLDGPRWAQLLHGYRGALTTLEARLGPPVWTEARSKLAALDHDLAAWPAPPNGRVTHTVDHIRAALECTGHTRLLGWMYVFEGATLGGRILAPRVEASTGQRSHYLQPYGDRGGPMWRDFVAEMDATVPPESFDAVVAGANDAFDAIANLMDAAW